MFSFLIGLFTKIKQYSITTIVVTVSIFLGTLFVVWLWNSRSYYLELASQQEADIVKLEEQNNAKLQALVKYEELVSHSNQEIKNTLKLIEEYKNDKNIAVWNSIIVPEQYSKWLQRGQK